MKLSLSVITGNCEKDVERFLDTFQPYFDEVVMVRAIGNQTQDRTLEIAKKRGVIIGEYYNDDANDWPHVDDFAKARNESMNMCDGDWIMWADMDDTAEGLEHLREIIANTQADVIRCPYVVSEQGVVANYRERIWRNNHKQKWINPIHENLVGDDKPQAQTDRIKIIHIPRDDKGCTKERNLRILESIPEADRTHAHTFYLMTEYARRNDSRAVILANQFLAHPESGLAERFETCMTLASMAEDYATKAGIYCKAWMEDPSRAEPLYELTALSLSCDQPERALHYARLMMATKWPDKPTWNHRKMFYGFFRQDLFWQAMRANGKIMEADTRRRNVAVESGLPIISLLHATRNRGMQAIRCRMEWLKASDHPERVEHLFAVDTDDEYVEAFLRFPTVFIQHNNGGPVAAWNAAAQASKGEVLVQLSDDWKPTKGWDTAILNAIGDTSKPSVLAVSDGHRKDNLLCMAILTRQRYKEQGSRLFHPEFFSMFSDNWFSHCAFRDGVVIDARDSIVFEHIHPAFGRAEMDETYARSNDQYHYLCGAGIMRRLQDGIKVSADMEGWFDFRDVYDHVAKTIPDGGWFVEVGSWKGKSICYLHDRIEDLGKKVEITAVDTFEGDEGTGKQDTTKDFRENKGNRQITMCKNESVKEAKQTADHSLDGVFIDAAHDYASVRQDIIAWENKVKEGGFFGGHDADTSDVQQALEDCGIKYAIVGRSWIKIP